MIAIEVVLSDWLYRAVLSTEILTISRDYFRLRGSLERRIYELGRKHCGNQPRWKIGLDLLLKKSGALSSEKEFRRAIKRIASANVLPDYRIKFDVEKDQLIFYNRDGNKAAKAEFDDAMKLLHTPEPVARRRSKNPRRPQSIGSGQIDLELI